MKRCPNCQSTELYKSEDTKPNSVLGPQVVPYIDIHHTRPKVSVIVCAECGLMTYFIEKEAAAAIPNSPHWTKVNG